MANPNVIFSGIFVEELIRQGLKHVVLVPGSRHTSLVLAFAQHKDRLKIWSHLDERSASFFALGLAIASDEPVALVCTSGSAGANMLPAIIEAHQSRIPLIIITADRPHELRQSGANQTIDQLKFFGDYVRWFVDAPLPEVDASPVLLRHIRTLAGRALQQANQSPRGVVHINMPFRKPFEPDGDEKALIQKVMGEPIPMTYFVPNAPMLSEGSLQYFIDSLLTYDDGIIVCGTRTPYRAYPLIASLAQQLGYPILADGAGGMRFFDKINAMVLGAYDTALMREGVYPSPKVIVRFGDVPVSRWLNDYLARIEPQARFHISGDGIWADDQHHTTHFIHADPYELLRQTFNNNRFTTTKTIQSSWVNAFMQIEDKSWRAVASAMDSVGFFDGMVVYDTVNIIPENTTLFVGNSLPVRHIDQFAQPQAKKLHIHANRGASGIDGNISTALGMGAFRPDRPLVALVGDITFYHDMNGLLAAKRCGVPLTLIVLNNQGGGIFHRLPIHEYDPDFTEYFITPHGLDFSHAANLYDLKFNRVQSRDAFQDALKTSLASGKGNLIEVVTNAQQDLQERKKIIQAVHDALNTTL